MAEQQLNLMQKLFEIQKKIKTFATSEDSDKTVAGGKAAYRYTPGWEITEKIREEMDKVGIMLIPNCKETRSTLIEYPVYKDFHGTAMSFTKKEMFVEVTVEFTWWDTTSNEKAGPFVAQGYGANGTDKSGATALSMAKRYFLMNFFNFTTHEATDEQDAHDAGNIPGIASSNENVKTLSDGRSVQAIAAPQPVAPTAQPGQPMQGAYYQPGYCPIMQPAYGGVVPQQGMMSGPMPYGTAPAAAPAPQNYKPGSPIGEFNESDPNIQQAISTLMQYEKGTNTHQRCLNEVLGRLASIGYNSTEKSFLTKLVETAQNLRHGKK